MEFINFQGNRPIQDAGKQTNTGQTASLQTTQGPKRGERMRLGDKYSAKVSIAELNMLTSCEGALILQES